MGIRLLDSRVENDLDFGRSVDSSRRTLIQFVFFAMAILLAGGNLVDFGVEILLGSGERPDEKFDLTEILAEILPF